MEHKFDINDALLFINNSKIRKYYKKKQLKEYYKWFMENIDNNIAWLQKMINEMDGGAEWVADCSPESLKDLYKILCENIEGHLYDNDGRFFDEEPNLGPTPYPLTIEAKQWVGLNHDEMILAYLIYVYMGEVLIRNFPEANLKWELSGQTWKYSNYGHITLYISDFYEIDPTDEGYVCLLRIIKVKHGIRLFYPPYSLWELPEDRLYKWFYDNTDTQRGELDGDPRRMPEIYARMSPKKHLYDPRVYGHYKFTKEIDADIRAGFYHEHGPRKNSDAD